MGEYNGWSNYQTWNVGLWMDNDAGEYDYWRERAADILRDNEGDKHGAAVDLADELKEHLSEYNPLGDGASVYTDLLSHALGMVDYYEIAENWLGDIELDEDEDD